MREIKNLLYIISTVESSDNKEDLLYPKFHNKEPLQSDLKKIKFDSTVTEKFEESDSTNLDSVVGGSMNLAKQISVENFGFISRATPHGSHTVQISEDKQGLVVYREHKFALQEDYPKYTRFVLSTFLFLSLLGLEKDFFSSDYICFKLLQRLQTRIYPIIG
jgi:hypothetical protein